MGEVRSRRQVLNEKITRANAIRGWLEDRRAAAFERRALERKAALLAPQGGGHGITITMRDISARAASRDVEWARHHVGPNRAMRRAMTPSHRAVPPSINHTYANPARDLRKDRRLRIIQGENA